MQAENKILEDIKAVAAETAKTAKADKPAMEVKNLSFSYGKNKILKDVSFQIQDGQITTIMGANGSGKSTLINDTLQPILSQHFYRSLQEPLPYDSVE